MRFEEPKLDDRNFQEIVDELKRRIPRYCPEWTDHNVHDPGVTLIELFGYVAEQLLFQMNKVPLLHFVKFAQFLGVSLPTPQPARVHVDFWLSEKLRQNDTEKSRLIEAGAKVSTTQTETIAPIVFTTENSATILAPHLAAIIRHKRGVAPDWLSLETLTEAEGAENLFSDQPVDQDAFYFEFENDLSNHILSLDFDLDIAKATNINPTNPPFSWEAYTNKHEWEPIPYVKDSTRGFNSPGKVILYLPQLVKRAWPVNLRVSSTSTPTDDSPKYSIRVRITASGYDVSPSLKQIIEIATLGCTIEAVHTEQVHNEYLGESNGRPNQRFDLAHSPIVLPLHQNENLKIVPSGVEPDFASEKWEYTEIFPYPLPDENQQVVHENGADTHTYSIQKNVNSQPPKKLFTIDITTNQIRLAPAIQTPQGEVIQYGQVPEQGSKVYMTAYRYGGTTANVGSGAINVIKTSIPYIQKVDNRSPAVGGQDSPSLDALEAAVQMHMQYYTQKYGPKAINALDYVSMILNRFGEHVTKVESWTEYTNRSIVHLFVVGNLSFSTLELSRQNPSVLDVSDSIIEEIERYLYDYRLLTDASPSSTNGSQMHINVMNPHYVRVNVQVSATTPATQRESDEELRHRIEQAVRDYLHPVTGGPTGRGWSLGATITEQSVEWWLDSIREELDRKEPIIKIQNIVIDQEDTNPDRPELFNLNYALAIPGRCTVEFNS